MPKERYEEAVEWLADTIYGTVFDPKRYATSQNCPWEKTRSYKPLHRLQTMVEKSLRELPTCLEDPMAMAGAATAQLSVLPQS